ncbi:MAG: hypothetical protein DHS20C17_04770 [Cyclobacteriaceae bacterium]|nr:MAG: hypothetical protein DHS20C17_04770 [Cyclobacteriaceae bacterium]
MQRRHFVKSVSNAAIIGPWLPASNLFSKQYVRFQNDQLVSQLIEINDSKVATRLDTQITDKDHRWYGGSPNQYGIPNAASSCALIQDLSCAYTSPTSAYFQSERLIDSITRATEYLLAIQYEDGTVDLHTTNFHSPPDTAFRVEPLALSYHILSHSESKPLETLANLKQFLTNAGNALTIGGIHTPNHRWVVCMALAHINTLFPDEKYVKRVNQWLSEGIDIDPDGQYTEKSTTVYSPLVDRCLITVARLLEKPELLEPVRKNLEMTLYYIRPNFQVSTEASGRQDQYRIGTIAPYYYPYRYMALQDGNSRFAYIANYLESEQLNQISNSLIYLLQDGQLGNELPEEEPFNTNYVKYFKHSELVRIRRGHRDASILANNSLIFSYFKGNAALTGVRLASAFFGKGQFKSDTIEVNENEYILKQTLEGPYYQPLKSGTFEGTQKDFGEQRKTREQSEVQNLETTIIIKEVGESFELSLSIQGSENVPVALELGFREGGELSGVTPVKDIPDAYLVAEQQITYNLDGQSITISPGYSEHQWTQLRGALPKMEGPSVYLTGYTPLEWTLKIE